MGSNEATIFVNLHQARIREVSVRISSVLTGSHSFHTGGSLFGNWQQSSLGR